MAIRDGMGNLVARVRQATAAGTAEYTAGTVSYWSDDDLEDVLDGNSRMLIDTPLIWQVQNISGTSNYIIAQSGWRDFEEAASGTARWQVRDSAGSAVGTANYTVDYRRGPIIFATDQGGTSYYLTAYTYDVNAAAADIWRQRLAHFSQWYDFSADNQQFSRSQAFEHAKSMVSFYEQQTGKNRVEAAAGDMRTGMFVRTDLMRSYSDD